MGSSSGTHSSVFPLSSFGHSFIFSSTGTPSEHQTPMTLLPPNPPGDVSGAYPVPQVPHSFSSWDISPPSIPLFRPETWESLIPSSPSSSTPNLTSHCVDYNSNLCLWSNYSPPSPLPPPWSQLPSIAWMPVVATAPLHLPSIHHTVAKTLFKNVN